MRKFALPVVLVVAGLATGCVSQQAKDAISSDAARCDKFVADIDSGSTTRAQEQNFIRANRRAFHSLDNLVNKKPLPADLVPTQPGN